MVIFGALLGRTDSIQLPVGPSILLRRATVVAMLEANRAKLIMPPLPLLHARRTRYKKDRGVSSTTDPNLTPPSQSSNKCALISEHETPA